MSSYLQGLLDRIANSPVADQLHRIQRGIEKEGLRTTPKGGLAQTPHPVGAGSALTHPHITTDYSEALLEFITPVFDQADDAIHFLENIHRFAYRQIDDELIWANSMPCFLGGEESIPIARYGSSNVGQMKYIYRVGLANRYGKKMQTIAGIHYNFSLHDDFWPALQAFSEDHSTLQDFRTDRYFGLIRNFRRYSWLTLYLFGASPAVCPSFVEGRPHRLEACGGSSLYAPYGTSLRMGDLGYTNNAQQDLNVCYNSLDSYVETLGQAVNTPHPDYEALGVKVDGEYRQLNSHLLQIENEYYSDIRPKRVTSSGQKPLDALAQQGVEYIEIRNLDIDPFKPVGIDAQQARFLDCFLLMCLLQDSPQHSATEYAESPTQQRSHYQPGARPGIAATTPGPNGDPQRMGRRTVRRYQSHCRAA